MWCVEDESFMPCIFIVKERGVFFLSLPTSSLFPGQPRGLTTEPSLYKVQELAGP